MTWHAEIETRDSRECTQTAFKRVSDLLRASAVEGAFRAALFTTALLLCKCSVQGIGEDQLRATWTKLEQKAKNAFAAKAIMQRERYVRVVRACPCELYTATEWI